MNLRSINLNLLPILRALLRDQSVAQAARTLALSPSATSEALGRLRELLGDSLLVQVGRSMRLTPYAANLIEPVERLCLELEQVMRPGAFDPATLQRTFVIASIDYVALSTVHTLMPALRTAAPGVQLEFIDLAADLSDRATLGDVDLVIADAAFWSFIDSGQRLHSAPLLSDRLVVVFSPSHPLAQQPTLSMVDLQSYPHIGFRLSPQHAEHPLIPRGLNTPIHMQNPMLVPFMLDATLICVLPRLIVLQIAKALPLESRELPDGSSHYQLAVHWGAAQHKDPAHRWFRQRLINEMAIAIAADTNSADHPLTANPLIDADA